jgi:hypothetical protein
MIRTLHKKESKKKRTSKGGNRTEDDSHLPIKTRQQKIKVQHKKFKNEKKPEKA